VNFKHYKNKAVTKLKLFYLSTIVNKIKLFVDIEER